jgi:hypothetical protein
LLPVLFAESLAETDPDFAQRWRLSGGMAVIGRLRRPFFAIRLRDRLRQ